MLSHEDIRHNVIRKLRSSILTVINNIRISMPDVYANLKHQLEEYEKIVSERRDIPLIIKNERIIKKVGKPDIEVFGGKILIEVKVKPSEFKDAFNQLSKYIQFYPHCQYAVITNDEEWEFYRIRNGKLMRTAIDLNYAIQDVLIKGVQVVLSTENIKNVFNSVILLEDELYYVFQTYGMESGALFEAYRNIINRLYEGASEESIKKLFIQHTLMQMIVSSCLTASLKKIARPVDACSGAEIEAEVVLPYLNWWKTLFSMEINSSDERFLKSLCDAIYSKALLFDWESGSKEDIFRELYEILIDTDTRRKIGEYYTPLWLVEYMVDKISDDVGGLRGKIILDPFCGSGTFLVSAFYRKVQEGENPDDAIKEVIGFDINPLAVSIARAELMIAYQSLRKGVATPLIFNTDSASVLLRLSRKEEAISFLKELKELEANIGYATSQLYVSSASEVDFSEILKIESILREFFREVSGSKDIKQELTVKMNELKAREWKGILIKNIIDALSNPRSVEIIAELIRKYGDGIWAISISSLFAPYIIRNVKVDIIVTNPPWAQLTELRGSYGKLIREKAKQLLKGYEKTGQIIAGSDISSMLLYGCIGVIRDGHAFLMPEDVVYVAGSHYGLGKILTYSVVGSYDGEVVQVGYDAFQHGRLPAIVFLRKRNGEVSCCSMDLKWRKEYSKMLHLSDVKYAIEEREKYGDYIKKLMVYIKISPEEIKERLDVDEVVSKGDYIMGIFGGVKKRGAKKYAGLIFEEVARDATRGSIHIKLSGTNTKIELSEYSLNSYWKKLIYVGEIFPFYLNYIHNILLSSKGENDLKEFLQKFILKNMLNNDKIKVEILINEVKQPEKLKVLEENKWYAIYRRSRTFASFVLTPDDIQLLSDGTKHDIIVYDDCSYITTQDEKKAYYYSAILNYLAYKVIEKKGAFERHQFLRPLIAIILAGLEWRNERWQTEISKLSKKLHQEAPKCFKGFIRRGMQVEECFKKLKTCTNTKNIFKTLIKTIDSNVNKEKLHEALKLVCKLD